jgi:hypothetical protein
MGVELPGFVDSLQLTFNFVALPLPPIILMQFRIPASP